MRPQTSKQSGLIARLIDGYNPAITMLLSIWVLAIATRRYLSERDLLSQTGYEALTSLVYVIPVMLVAWAVLAVSDRVWGLGIFRRDGR